MPHLVQACHTGEMTTQTTTYIRPVGDVPKDPLFHTRFRVEHSLSDHPMLSLESVAGLARDLDDKWVEEGVEDAAKVVGFQYTRHPAPADKYDAIASIEGKNRIMYLDNIQTVPRYRTLVDELAPNMMSILGIEEADVVKTEGYMFVSGGPSTTMAHVDHECNILMVLEGTKRVWLSDIPDFDADRAVEAMYGGGYGSCDRMPKTMMPFDIHAGQGIFIAPRAAHMIENYPGRCVALSIVVTPKMLEEEAKVFRANYRMRKLGFRPSNPGDSKVSDTAKNTVESTWAKLRSLRPD